MIVSLALGIGANSAIFTIIDTVLLRPLPYPRSPELLTVGLANKTGVSWHISPRDVQAWVEGVHTLSAIATFSPYPASIRGSLNTEYREGAQVSSNLLRVLGTRPAFGRWFAADDDRAGAARVVVISNEVWHQQFAGDSLVIGRTLTIYNEPWAIIGVMPRGAAPPLQAAFWIPAGTSGGQIIARPQPGVPIASIQRELARLSPSIASARAVGRPYELVIMSLHDQLYGAARSTLRLLFCAVTLLLLIACANTANLSLARVLERRHEMTVRATLGASRWSLASIVITENLLLAGAAGVLGIAVGFWTTRVFIPISPEEITRAGALGVDGAAVAYASVLTLVAMIVVSVAPVLASTRGDLAPALAQGGPRGGHRRSTERLRKVLVVSQLAIALVLMTGAGLFVRSVARLSSVDLGFNPRGTVVATINLMTGGTSTGSARGHQLLSRIAERLSVMPGVQAVSIGPPPMVAGRGRQLSEGADMIWFARFANETGADSTRRTIWVKFVDAGYLNTFRIPMKAGRGIALSDDASAPAVALLNAAAAKLFFPDGNAVGRPFATPPASLSGGRPIAIIGVFANVHQRDVAMDAEPEILVPSQQQDVDVSSASVSVRTAGDEDAMVPTMRRVLDEVAPGLPAMRITTMRAVVEASLAPHRFLLFLLSAFAILAIALSALGLYAVVAYLAAQRTQELGIRMALGAQQHQLVGLVVGEGMALVGLGIGLGVPAALTLSRVLASLLFEVKAHDLQAFVAAPILLAAVALAAAFAPAFRASKVDPMLVLRRE